MDGKYIQSKSMLDMVNEIYKTAKQQQAAFLTDLQELLGKDSTEFKTARKLYLDSSNDFTRSVIRDIFGDTFEVN